VIRWTRVGTMTPARAEVMEVMEVMETTDRGVAAPRQLRILAISFAWNVLVSTAKDVGRAAGQRVVQRRLQLQALRLSSTYPSSVFRTNAPTFVI
jgi:hypothetical protein